MATWTPDLAGFAGPKYQAIADALALAIRHGELKAGDRLPPQRDLAARLGFDLTTVTRGYDTARERGLIVARGRAGSFVRDAARASMAAALQIDTGMNNPPVPQNGMLEAAIAETTRAVLAGDASALLYQSAGGDVETRRAGAALLARLGVPSEPDQVVVTAGGQNALHAIVGAAARRGERIACGRFVYPGFRAVAQRAGIELVPLADMTGEALEAACREGPVRALYLVPTNDNPTTATLSVDERARIAEVARKHCITVIEDDAYGLLPTDPLPTLASLAPERTWYVASLSKVVSPALRVAFVRAPGMGEALRLAADVHETAVMAPPLNAAIVSAWLGDGTFDRLIAATRAEAAWRRKLASRVLGETRFASHPQGYHLWVALPEGVSASELSQTLALAGIGAIPSDRFAVGATHEQALRVALGGIAEPATLEAALRSLEGHLTASQRLRDTVI